MAQIEEWYLVKTDGSGVFIANGNEVTGLATEIQAAEAEANRVGRTLVFARLTPEPPGEGGDVGRSYCPLRFLNRYRGFSSRHLQADSGLALFTCRGYPEKGRKFKRLPTPSVVDYADGTVPL